MKLSLSWIFDYIDGDWKSINIDELVHKFNTITAEIEHVHKISFNLDEFSLVHVSSIGQDQIVADSQEWGAEFILPARADAKKGNFYLVRKAEGTVKWATMRDWGTDKEGLIGALACAAVGSSSLSSDVASRHSSMSDGGWKKDIASTDYILDVDNKSITNRPDLWCHRGFAREIAAILDLPFKDFDPFLANKVVTDFLRQAQDDRGGVLEAPAAAQNPFTISLEDDKACPRFAGLYFPDITNQSSLIWMASRLVRVDSKPIDLLVDLTNYVMLDMSQPMHAFDADKLPSKMIAPRFAKNGQKLELLDGQTITLTSDDFVIIDGEQPVALAGVMGGKKTGVSADTKSIFLEAASFNPSMVRTSALRHKIRTDSSARFEKSLDPNQNVLAIRRLLKILDDNQITYTAAPEIVSLGQYFQDSTIEVAHSYIEKRLGVQIASDFVVKTLKKIDFEVKVYEENGDPLYIVTVPSFRGSKDVIQKEDILEEVVRFFGFDNIPLVLPAKQMSVSDLGPLNRLRAIKNHMAFAADMHEIASYGFFDESYLKELGYIPKDTVTLKNPVSQNWQHLVTTLIPHMLKAVQENSASENQLRFFEWARIWSSSGKDVIEKRSLASIAYDASAKMSFYDAKAFYDGLFHMLELPVTWVKSEKLDVPWYDLSQTAYIMHEGNCIGAFGRLAQSFMDKISDKGNAFICELNGDFLISYAAPTPKFKQLPKFPHISLDISAMVPLSVTVDSFKEAIGKSDDHIVSVALVDIFEKPEWKDKKAVTMSFVIQDESKTLSREDADAVWEKVVASVKKLGGEIR